MKKRPLVAVLNTVAASGANVVDDISTSGDWGIVKTSAGGELLLGAFRGDSLKKVTTYSSQAEVPQIVGIGLTAAGETVTASTRYRIEIGNPEDTYETHRRFPIIHAYTTPVTLSGNAGTDRLNLYTALANKINSYPRNNVRAALCNVLAFTTGSVAALTPGELVTQGTSSKTARVAKVITTSGTIGVGNAAGYVFLYDVESGWNTASQTITGTGNGTILATGAGTAGHGMVIIDDTGYYVSHIERGGVNWIGATQGFETPAELLRKGIYSAGIGADMLRLMPIFDATKMDVVKGRLEYDLQNNDLFESAKTYTKIVMLIEDGDEEAMAGNPESAYREVILYADESDGTNLTALITELGPPIAQ